MVKVCDALCGFGKTSACIRMMNEEKEKRFIFVTQFLSEVDRIMESCSERDFVSPASDVKLGQTKLADVHTLLEEGRNIATTHALFVSYTDATKELIREKGYTLVLDEAVDILYLSEIADCDLKLLKRSGAIKESEGLLEWTDDEYGYDDKGKFREEMMKAKSKNLIKFGDDYLFWSIPPELFTCFRDVYVLTYMFQAQPLKCFFEIHGIDYQYIGVRKHGEKYEFCLPEEMERTLNLRSKVHILESEKLNHIGAGRTALSVSWYRRTGLEKHHADLDRVRKNLLNVFKNIYKVSGNNALWTTFKAYADGIKGNGYYNAFIPYNLRASNAYASRRYLAYLVNNFPRPMEQRYYRENGSEWNSDMYALSTLIQWMFRSSIRRGEEIWIYIPSERMRFLLKVWLNNLAEGRDLEPIEYRKKRRSPVKKVIGAKIIKNINDNKMEIDNNENL